MRIVVVVFLDYPSLVPGRHLDSSALTTWMVTGYLHLWLSHLALCRNSLAIWMHLVMHPVTILIIIAATYKVDNSSHLSSYYMLHLTTLPLNIDVLDSLNVSMISWFEDHSSSNIDSESHNSLEVWCAKVVVQTGQLIDGDHGRSSSQESMQYFFHNAKTVFVEILTCQAAE